ncbi:MAG TPA: metal ABC transporter permease [Methanocorpusculum sp.]|nr:metal ABC transporter permease [Methanocorpusculum sp.]HJK79306.1 metal ABC transporter permease [Methanocorpusculum sp.]
MTDLLSYVFMQHAFLAAGLASVVCGIIGSYIIVRQMTAVSGGISHATFGGVGLGYLLGFSPIAGAAGFAVCAAVVIGVLKEYAHQKVDMLIGAVWAVGMALGVLFVALTPGYVPDIESYLFGNILLVTSGNLVLAGVLAVVIMAVVALLYQPFLAVTFDEEYATVMNLPVKLLNLLLLILIALAVVMLIQVVGIILVIALLTLPAASCRMLTSRLWVMMAGSVAIAAVASFGGILLSYFWNIPSGATITLAAAAMFLLVIGVQRCAKRRR